MRPVARLTRASLLRLGREMEERGIEEIDVHRIDLDSRWIGVLLPGGSRIAMISREGRTPDEEAAADAEAKREKRKVRK